MEPERSPSRTGVRRLLFVAVAIACLVVAALLAKPAARARWPGLLDRLIETTMTGLIATPDRYSDRRVRVIGYLHLEFEGDELCPTAEVRRIKDSRSCVWIEPPPGSTRLSDHYVLIEGRFSSKDRGHLGMFGGTIADITRADVWEPASWTPAASERP
jgi:hypothetical protein